MTLVAVIMGVCSVAAPFSRVVEMSKLWAWMTKRVKNNSCLLKISFPVGPSSNIVPEPVLRLGCVAWAVKAVSSIAWRKKLEPSNSQCTRALGAEGQAYAVHLKLVNLSCQSASILFVAVSPSPLPLSTISSLSVLKEKNLRTKTL